MGVRGRRRLSWATYGQAAGRGGVFFGTHPKLLIALLSHRVAHASTPGGTLRQRTGGRRHKRLGLFLGTPPSRRRLLLLLLLIVLFLLLVIATLLCTATSLFFLPERQQKVSVTGA
jgi:polyferredoxin